MPRRPRPASRPPPQNVLYKRPGSKQLHTHKSSSSGTIAGAVQQKAVPKHRAPTAQTASTSSSSEVEGDEQESEGSASSADDSIDGFDVDVDAPRVAQWLDEELLDQHSEEESSADAEGPDTEEPSHLTSSLQDDIASLSFGALRKAQQQLATAHALHDSEHEKSSDEDASEPEFNTSRSDVKGKGKEVGQLKKKVDIPKRSSKHAPTEVTFKRPVPRKKLTEGEKIVPRDPRFLPLAGEFSTQKFTSQYGFLANMHLDEMKNLKENLKRARKLLLSSPRDLREEREQEVQRLERAVKRAESMVNKDHREKIEQEALSKVAKEERDKQKEGKGAWFMKDADKKQLLIRAKYEALATSGNKGAVKKAIEKKQKKVGQKEKKRRPFVPGEAGGGPRRPAGGLSTKRTHSRDDGQGSSKRRRVG